MVAPGLGGYSDGNFALARYNSNGSLDAAFLAKLPTSINAAPTGNVTITGTPKQGQPLSVSNALADADGLGTISYPWKARRRRHQRRRRFNLHPDLSPSG